MAESTTQSITIDAPPESIMDVIADFPAYPEWAGAVKSTEVVETGPDGRAARVAFIVDAGMFKDSYTLAYDWAPDGLSVRWRLVKGQIQKAQEGAYVLEPVGEATTVTYALSVELNIPMIGLLRRKAEKIIIDTALKELKRRVES
jgi:ribosome-associated toxin RatA of RatAB toxin-antitoxin module